MCVHRSLLEPCGLRVCVPLRAAGGSEASGMWGVDSPCSTFLLPELHVGVSTLAREEEGSKTGLVMLDAEALDRSLAGESAEEEGEGGGGVLTIDAFTSPPRRVKVPGRRRASQSSPESLSLSASKGEETPDADAGLYTPGRDRAQMASPDTPPPRSTEVKAAGLDESRVDMAEFPSCADPCRSELWSSFVLAGRCAFKLRPCLLAAAFLPANGAITPLAPLGDGSLTLAPPPGH